MQFYDQINGTTTGYNVKDRYPKTITGGVIIPEVPAYSCDAVDVIIHP